MQSSIYEGFVRHRRFDPAPHEFRSRLFMMYLDLSELPVAFQGRWLWSIEKPNVATFCRRDHFGEATVSLDETIRNLVESETGQRPPGPIRLLTHLRYFGYCFNPISLFFCFDQADEQLHSVVAEVTNTPWGERHCYVLDPESNRSDPIPNVEKAISSEHGVDIASHRSRPEETGQAHFLGPIDTLTVREVSGQRISRRKNEPVLGRATVPSQKFRRELKPILKNSFTFEKTFHVSPFMPMDFEYRWQLSGPGEQLVLHTENWRNGRVDFDATLTLGRQDISTWTLASVLLWYPLQTLQVIANIHWQAFRLWWKGVSYVPHPKTGQIETLMKNTDESTDAASPRN